MIDILQSFVRIKLNRIITNKGVINISIIETPKVDAGPDGLAIHKRRIINDYPSHLHNVFELEYVINGEATVFIDGKPISIRAKSLKLTTPLDIERVTLRTPVLTIINVNFTENFINPKIMPLLSSGFIVDNVGDMLINMLIDEFESQRPYNLICQSNILNLILLDALRKKNSNASIEREVNKSKHGIAHQVANYIHIHYREPLTLKEIANHFSYTQNHLNKLFLSTFDTTIMKYLSKTRIDQVEKLLVCSDMSVTQICIECGFSSISTFFRIFKEYNKMSPKEYRDNFKFGLNQIKP